MAGQKLYRIGDERTDMLRFLDGRLQQRWRVKWRTRGGGGGHYGDLMEGDTTELEWRDVPEVSSKDSP